MLKSIPLFFHLLVINIIQCEVFLILFSRSHFRWNMCNSLSLRRTFLNHNFKLKHNVLLNCISSYNSSRLQMKCWFQMTSLVRCICVKNLRGKQKFINFLPLRHLKIFCHNSADAMLSLLSLIIYTVEVSEAAFPVFIMFSSFLYKIWGFSDMTVEKNLNSPNQY